MTAEPPGDFVLTADVAGSGHFERVGTVPVPAPAFAAALADFRNGEADLQTRESLIHALAIKVAGCCVLDCAQAEKKIEACFQSWLIAEWRISLPGLGVLQALFRVVQFERTASAGIYNIAFQLAGKPEFAAAQRETAGIS
jgi:predicted secreted protein